MNRSLFLALAATLLSTACQATTDDIDIDEEEEIGEIEDGVTVYTGTVFNTGGLSLNVRSKPSTSGAVLTTIASGTKVKIKCQVEGQWIGSTSVWNYLYTYDGYVSDEYLLTGYDGFIPGVPKCSGGGGSSPPSGGGSSSVGLAAVAEARSYLGSQEWSGNCNEFSPLVGNYDCPEWCSDFVRYVWGQAGAKTAGLTGYSMTFHDYGVTNGTWKPAKPGVVVKPGDAVVWGAPDFSWGAHVGMVTDVSGSTFRTIHGNFDVQGNGTGDDVVAETGYVDIYYQAGTGYPMLGFISPVK